MNPIRIVIIDDHTLLRDTWSFTISTDSRFRVEATAGSAEEGIELCRQYKPDVAILDINLPKMNGMEAIPLIRKESPATNILAVSLHSQRSYVKRMMQAGALGYVTKNSSRKEMMEALIQVAAGKKFICEEIKTILAQNLLEEDKESKTIYSLTARELEIIRFIKKGLSSKEIADEIHLSTKTVEVHRYNILKKLSLKNSAALVDYINKSDLGD